MKFKMLNENFLMKSIDGLEINLQAIKRAVSTRLKLSKSRRDDSKNIDGEFIPRQIRITKNK